MDGLASYLAAHGYVGLTYDCIGHKLGATGGEIRHMRQAVGNLRDAVLWLRNSRSVENIVLVGHSMGGVLVTSLGCEAAQGGALRIAGIVSLAAGANPSSHFTGVVGKTMLEQRSDYISGASAVKLIGDLDEIVSCVRGLGEIPSLFVAARNDVLVPVSQVEALARRAGPSAALRVVDSSHLDAPDRSRGVVLEWLEHLDGAPRPGA